MKIAIRKSLLESMLVNLQPFLEKKDNSQITSHICLDAHHGRLIVKATDYEMGLRLESEFAGIEEEGSATANGKKLLDIIKILKDEDVRLTTSDDHLVIKQKGASYKLPMFHANDFPSFPDSSTLSSINLDTDKLVISLKKIIPAIDTNNPKFELNGALIDMKTSGINLVGTDTRRLAIVFMADQSDQELSLIIPKKAITEIQKLFNEPARIHYDNATLIISTQTTYFFTRLINGKYPDYQRILPKEFRHDFTVERDRFLEAMKQVSVIAPEIKMTFSAQAITFESLSSENIEAKSEMEFTSDLPGDFTIAVNSRYLTDFIASLESREFHIKLNQPNTPFQLESGNFVTIIMPIIL
ncbi:MAG: DNA polymerase III subunit beta [Campylobacterales bacterium]